jgi:DNA repair protein SbcC/Rad50
VILRRLRVHPFGRFADREVSFGPSLTVVLGPNEAGKSTLLDAVKAALFVPAKLSKPKFQEYLGRFVPVDGGDVVRADIAFEAGGGEYVIARRWGTGAASEMRQPHGGQLADEKAIADRVAGLLPASPRTMVTVLVVGQADLGDTVAALGANGALDDVSTLVRRVVQETGGVSVDAVRRRIGEAVKDLYERWDRTRAAPESGRGIERPWEKGVGEVLAAWYTAERLRVDLERARAKERDLDELNRKIEAVEASLGAHERFLRSHEGAVRDAGERRVFEAELAAENGKRAQLVRDTDEWPVREADEVRLAGEIAAAEARLPGLVDEQRAAEADQAGRTLREKAGRVQRLRARVAEAEAALAVGPKIDRAALAGIQAAHLEAERTGAAGRGLSLRLAARAAARIELCRGDGSSSTMDLAAGESLTVEAGPSFTLGLRDLDIGVHPAGSAVGQGDAARRLAALLAVHGVADAAAADAACRAREALAADLDRARRDIVDELAGESPEAFAARAAVLGPARERRPLKDVARDLAVAEAALATLRKDRQAAADRIGQLAATYGARDRLHAALGESARWSGELEGKIAACAPLPAGFADAAAFIASYEAERKARERAKDDLNGLLRQRDAREAAAPDQSFEELEGQHADARARFAAALARAKAVDRVAAAVEAVAGSDDGIFSGLADEVARRFSALSLGAHPGVVMRDRLPRAVRTATGAELPWEWLSAGAKDLLGLAVRLAMASVVIADAGGFLLMDDPLVDLDPERQAAAAEAIREFAGGRQTIVFTCHPEHAELLGGELVRLA